MFFAYYYYPDPIKPIEAEATSFTGKIVSEVDDNPQRTTFVFQEPRKSAKIQVSFFKNNASNTSSAPISWKTGATCQITGERTVPKDQTNPGQFSYQQHLSKQAISSQLTLENREDLLCSGSSFRGEMYRGRQTILLTIEENLSHMSASWMQALFFGEKDLLDDSIVSVFRRWNLSHLLAISGLHIGLIAGFLYVIFVRTGLFTKKKANYLLIIILFIYPFFTGGSPSIWRATAMTIIGLACWKRRHIFTTSDTVSIVFLLFVIADQQIIYQLSFQFSFLVTFSIMLSRQFLARRPNKIVLLLWISMISMFSVLPIQIENFYFINPLGLLLNIIAIPYFTLFVLPVLFVMIVSLVIAPFLVPFIDWIFTSIHQIGLAFFISIDQSLYSPVVIGEFPNPYFSLYFLFFIGLMISLDNKNWRQASRRGGLLVMTVFILMIRPYFNPNGTVTMLDVGQGDALVIELPYRQGIIIYDAAGVMENDFETPSDRIYQQVIKPYLYSRGISKVDALILSHAHHDHIGSVPYLIEEISIRNVIISEYFVMPPELAEVIGVTGQQVLTVKASDRLNIKGQIFTVLSPGFDWNSKNDNSLVLTTELGPLSWLLTGDISGEVEEQIVGTYPNLQIDVLSVSHHGSITSSSEHFLQKIEPRVAWISVGENNRYQHPDSEVLNRLKQQDVKIYRTDRHGAVQYVYHDNRAQGTFLPFNP